MSKIMVRKHRGGYAESMATAKEIDATLDAVAKYFEQPVERITVEPYSGIDRRNGWDTYIVCLYGAAIGMTNGGVK
jgi:hypothetical protein